MYPCKKLSFLRKHFPGIRLLSQGLMTHNYSKTCVEYRMVDNHVRYTNDSRCPVPNGTGNDNSNKRCFEARPKLFRESGDFPGNRDTWKFFRETRDNSGALQKKSGHRRKFYFMHPKNSGGWSKFPGRLKLRPSIAQTAFVRVVTPRFW